MTKLTQRLLDQAAKHAEKGAKIQSKLTEAFNDRYGITYSDVDADGIIDVLDYGGGAITLEYCDEEMTDRGYPPLRNRDADRSD